MKKYEIWKLNLLEKGAITETAYRYLDLEREYAMQVLDDVQPDVENTVIYWEKAGIKKAEL